MEFKTLFFLSIVCFASCTLGRENRTDRLTKRSDGPGKIFGQRDCDTQYYDLMSRYTEKVIHYVSWYLQNYGYDPKTMPDAADTIEAKDPNSVEQSGYLTLYNAYMYDHSKFDAAWRMGVDCNGDFLGVEVIMNVPQIKIRSRFELKIANSDHHGFIDSKADDYSFRVNYSVSYGDLTVHKFSIFQENISHFSCDTNYYDPVMSWTFNSIENTMSAIFATLYNDEYKQIVTAAFYVAFQSLKIFS